jgi:hypothetical protein
MTYLIEYGFLDKVFGIVKINNSKIEVRWQ